jgi:hypothetical protein
VTAFYDIGRGGWSSEARSRDVYLRSFAQYTARMSDDLYVLCDNDVASAIKQPLRFLDVAPLAELAAYRYFPRTAEVMARPEFRALFKPEDDKRRIEHKHPLYNIVMLAKWDALERAFRRTEGRYSHYVWADFGLGKRGMTRASMPPFERFAPVERDRIVLSASSGLLPRRDCHSLTKWVRTFRDLVAGNLMIVPNPLLETFVAMARKNYERLLDCGLSCDDQLVTEMCVAERPGMFYLSYQRREGRARFAHVHDIVCGTNAPTLQSNFSRFFFSNIARIRNATGI